MPNLLSEILDALDAVDAAFEAQRIGWSLERDAALCRLTALRKKAREITTERTEDAQTV